jgi:hypothetical protein
MRRPRSVGFRVRDSLTSSSGVAAAAAMVCAAMASLSVASCTPTATDTPAPPAVKGTGGGSGAGGQSPGPSSSGGSGGTTTPGPGTDPTPPADAKPDATSEADAAPSSPSDASASGGPDTTTAGADTGAGGAKFPPGTIAKIMVLGSSNETATCWRAFLWQKLRAAGVMNFDFVGRTNTGPGCGVAGYDKDLEGMPGTIITNFKASDFALRYKANPPDMVLVHVGGADARNGIAPMRIIEAYGLAVEQARLVNPRVIFFVGLHTPQQPMTGVLELNAAIPVWAKQISTPDSPVFSVDLYKGIVSATDLSDGTHLNEAGSMKVADWFLGPMLPFFKP